MKMSEPNADIQHEAACDRYYRLTGEMPPEEWTTLEIEVAIEEWGADL